MRGNTGTSQTIILNFSREPADQPSVTSGDDLIARELMLNRFKKLAGELMRGQLTRQTFEPWEVEILVDLEACQLDPRQRIELLKQYRRAVERQMEHGAGPPMRFSQFLVERARRTQ